jgi:hypothetical protein
VTDRSLVELAALAEELCDTRPHAEPIWVDNGHGNKRLRRIYATTQPGLLEQLREIAHKGLKVGEGVRATGKPASRPPGCFDALNVHHYIGLEAYRWAQAYATPKPATEDNIRILIGLAPSFDDGTFDRLVTDVRYWRGMAATSTGWVERPYTPRVRCPMCQRFGSIRVNIEGKSAYCTNRDRRPSGDLACGQTWPPGMAAPLFDWIRTELEMAA